MYASSSTYCSRAAELVAARSYTVAARTTGVWR